MALNRGPRGRASRARLPSCATGRRFRARLPSCSMGSRPATATRPAPQSPDGAHPCAPPAIPMAHGRGADRPWRVVERSTPQAGCTSRCRSQSESRGTAATERGAWRASRGGEGRPAAARQEPSAAREGRTPDRAESRWPDPPTGSPLRARSDPIRRQARHSEPDPIRSADRLALPSLLRSADRLAQRVIVSAACRRQGVTLSTPAGGPGTGKLGIPSTPGACRCAARALPWSLP